MERNKKEGIKLMTEINTKLRIKPKISNPESVYGYIRIQVKCVNTLKRINEYINNKYPVSYPYTHIDVSDNHHWVDICNVDGSIFITYHL
jgi:hypothetical protein